MKSNNFKEKTLPHWNKTKRSKSIVEMWILYEYILWGMGLTSPVQRPHNTVHLSDIGQNILIYVERRRHIRGLFHVAAGQKISHFFSSTEQRSTTVHNTKCSF
jgi:hypothetical protein